MRELFISLIGLFACFVDILWLPLVILSPYTLEVIENPVHLTPFSTWMTTLLHCLLIQFLLPVSILFVLIFFLVLIVDLCVVDETLIDQLVYSSCGKCGAATNTNSTSSRCCETSSSTTWVSLCGGSTKASEITSFGGIHQVSCYKCSLIFSLSNVNDHASFQTCHAGTLKAFITRSSVTWRIGKKLWKPRKTTLQLLIHQSFLCTGFRMALGLMDQRWMHCGLYATSCWEMPWVFEEF